MVPRPEIAALRADSGLSDALALVGARSYSRYPVYERSLDDVVGTISAKQILAALDALGRDVDAFTVRRFMTPHALFVPESRRADQVLADMKRNRCHMAIVIDEFGETVGLVTFRDVVSRLVEDLEDVGDELDTRDTPSVVWLDGFAEIDGRMHLSSLERQLSMHIPESDFETIGGLVFGRLGRRPLVGDEVALDGYRFVVQDVDGLRITRLRVAMSEQAATPD